MKQRTGATEQGTGDLGREPKNGDVRQGTQDSRQGTEMGDRGHRALGRGGGGRIGEGDRGTGDRGNRGKTLSLTECAPK
jgi:hypothetical protein